MVAMGYSGGRRSGPGGGGMASAASGAFGGSRSTVETRGCGVREPTWRGSSPHSHSNQEQPVYSHGGTAGGWIDSDASGAVPIRPLRLGRSAERAFVPSVARHSGYENR